MTTKPAARFRNFILALLVVYRIGYWHIIRRYEEIFIPGCAILSHPRGRRVCRSARQCRSECRTDRKGQAAPERDLFQDLRLISGRGTTARTPSAPTPFFLIVGKGGCHAGPGGSCMNHAVGRPTASPDGTPPDGTPVDDGHGDAPPHTRPLTGLVGRTCAVLVAVLVVLMVLVAGWSLAKAIADRQTQAEDLARLIEVQVARSLQAGDV